jgi:hypothetical protein
MDRETVRDVRMVFEDFLAALADTRKCFRDSGQWADEDVVPGETHEEWLEFLAENVRNQISALYTIDRPAPVVDREAVRRVVTAAFRSSNNTGPDADQRLQAFVDDILALATKEGESVT